MAVPHWPLSSQRRRTSVSAADAITAAITAGIEQMIRDDPGQWLWIHNRWAERSSRGARDAELMRDKS